MLHYSDDGYGLGVLQMMHLCDSINTWDELARNFLAKYFQSSKIMKFRMDIMNFQQLEEDSLCEAWERFKLMLCKVPYNGFVRLAATLRKLRASLDGVSAEVFMSKTYTEACQLIKDMIMNSYMWLA
ncbi:Retrotransposon gag protein [Gossypium australe]|uniref:Retrotransposon gag protein n=1 Tax=Gossypium australe TaxID=47621 RepID=A0A5B6X2P6_9ROSI|nr:Retrotransposon gag protein [Gossypium australe]